MDDKILFLLKKVVAINSVYPNEEKLIDFLFSYLKKRNIFVIKQKVSENRFNLLAEKGKGEKAVLFLSHADTVNLTGNWQTNPFQLTQKGDRLFGLGAWDMKGGLVVNLLTFLESNPKNYQFKLAITIDEENISLGGYTLAKSDFIKNVDCLISTEPAFRYGIKGMVIGRSGRAVYQVILSRPSLHSAFYHPKKDLNLVLADFINQIKSFYQEKGDKKRLIQIRKIRTENIGMSLVSKIEIELESMVIPPLSHQKVLERLKRGFEKILKRYDSKIKCEVNFYQRKTPFLEPYLIKKDNFYLKKLKQSVKDVTHQQALLYFRSSVADDNIFGAMGKIVLGIGPEGGNAHNVNEWVSLNSLIKLKEILTNFTIKITSK